MGIFEVNKTTEDIKKAELIRCAEYRKGAVDALKSAIIVSFNDFWNNRILTPQEICDANGTDAALLFSLLSDLNEFIKTKLDPSFKLPDIPYEYTINADGTVVIGDRKTTTEEEVNE